MRITRNFYAYYEGVLITIHYTEIQGLLTLRGKIAHEVRVNGTTVIEKSGSPWIKDAGTISASHAINGQNYRIELEMIRSFSIVEYRLRVNSLEVALAKAKGTEIESLLAKHRPTN